MAKDLGNQKVAQLILNTELPREIKKIGSSLIATIEWRKNGAHHQYDRLSDGIYFDEDLKRICAKKFVETIYKML